MTDSNGFNTTMLMTPANGVPYMGGYGNNGGLFGNGDSWLGILFLIALCNGGFGFGGGFGGGYGNMMLGYDFPWLLNGQNQINANTNSGFRDAQLCNCCGDMTVNMNNGFAGVNQNLCSGFAGVNASINGAQNAIAQQMYTNQLADLERSFNAQAATTGGLTNISAQLAQCCADRRCS